MYFQRLLPQVYARGSPAAIQGIQGSADHHRHRGPR